MSLNRPKSYAVRISQATRPTFQFFFFKRKLIAALIHSSQKGVNPNVHQQKRISKMWYRHKMSIVQNDVLTNAPTLENLENITLKKPDIKIHDSINTKYLK